MVATALATRSTPRMAPATRASRMSWMASYTVPGDFRQAQREDADEEAAQRAEGDARHGDAARSLLRGGERGEEGRADDPGGEPEHAVGGQLFLRHQRELPLAVHRPAADGDARERGGHRGCRRHRDHDVDPEDAGDDLHHEEHRREGSVVGGGESGAGARGDQHPRLAAGQPQPAAEKQSGPSPELDDGPFAADGRAAAERHQRGGALEQHRRQPDAAASQRHRFEDHRHAVAARAARREQADGRGGGASGGGKGQARHPGQRVEALQHVAGAEQEPQPVMEQEPEGDGEARAEDAHRQHGGAVARHRLHHRGPKPHQRSAGRRPDTSPFMALRRARPAAARR